MGYDVRKFENNMTRFDKDNDGKGDVGLDVMMLFTTTTTMVMMILTVD